MTLNSSSSMFSDPQLESLLAGLATNEAETLIRTSALIQHISYRDGFGFKFVYFTKIMHILTVAPCFQLQNRKGFLGCINVLVIVGLGHQTKIWRNC